MVREGKAKLRSTIVERLGASMDAVPRLKLKAGATWWFGRPKRGILQL